jgi:bacteriorhodopsin
VSTDNGTKWLFWVLAMIPFVYILYVLVNELKQVKSRENATIADITTKAGYGLAILAIAKARSASEPN